MIRVAHATDIHWFVPPPWTRLWGKRTLGTANLYLRDRRHHFDARVQDELVAALAATNPDAVVITGDLTAQALPEEFALAHHKLAPLLAGQPSFVQSGNHDVYTLGAAREDRIAAHFGPWLHRRPGGLARLDLPGFTVIGLDASRPHPTASGRVPEAELAALPDALAATNPDDAVMLALHYPLLDRRGGLYDGWGHGLRNAAELVEALRRAPRRPTLVVHGHQHHGYTVPLDLGDAVVPIHDPGASGYADLPEHDRAACFNVYVLDGPRLASVERYRHGPGGFQPEAGGPYATGR